jgi:hypothetical protein
VGVVVGVHTCVGAQIRCVVQEGAWCPTQQAAYNASQQAQPPQQAHTYIHMSCVACWWGALLVLCMHVLGISVCYSSRGGLGEGSREMWRPGGLVGGLVGQCGGCGWCAHLCGSSDSMCCTGGYLVPHSAGCLQRQSAGTACSTGTHTYIHMSITLPSHRAHHIERIT